MMKKLLAALLAATLLLSACGKSDSQTPAKPAEDAPERTLRFTLSQLLSYSEWEKVFTLPQVEDYFLVGFLDNATIPAGEGFVLSGDSEVDQYGASIAAYEIVQGTDILPGSIGSCIMPKAAADKGGQKVGDVLSVTTEKGTHEYKIAGLYTFGERAQAMGLTEENTPLIEIFISVADMLSLVGQEDEGYFVLSTVTCKTKADLEPVKAEIEKLLAGTGISVELPPDGSTAAPKAADNEADITSLTPIDGTDLEGAPLPGEVLKPGGITMVNIWATFCNPCIDEMPDLAALNSEYEAADKNLKIIGICLDVLDPAGKADENNLALAKEIVAQTGADYLHILPGESLRQLLMPRVTSVPTTLFVNDQGEVLQTVLGSRSKEKWTQKIDEVLSAHA